MQLWESANIDFICFANKGVNHRHQKSRPGIPRDSSIGLFSNNYNNYSPVFTCQFRIRMTKN